MANTNSSPVNRVIISRSKILIFTRKPTNLKPWLAALKKHRSNRGCLRGVMVKAMDYGIVVSEFVLHSCYYVHFRANTVGKGMIPLILPAMG